jgi:hypothetical protein
MRVLVPSLVAVAALAGGCGSARDAATPEPRKTSSDPVTVTRDDPALPAGCRPAEVVELVERRLAARGDGMKLRELAVGFANGLGQIEIKARAGARLGEGKGAVDCEQGRIVAWGMGITPPGQEVAAVCPAAPQGGPVACAREWTT